MNTTEIINTTPGIAIYPALSLAQPYATLVIKGLKKWETRGWRPKKRVAHIFIHASKSKQYRDVTQLSAFKDHIPDFDALPFGGIIGVVRVGRFEPTQKIVSELDQQEIAFGDYSPGRHAWELLEPDEWEEMVPCRGALSLWWPKREVFDKRVNSII